MDDDGETPHLLPTASRPTDLFPDVVRFVGIWTLCTASLFLGSFTLTCAVDHYYYHAPYGQCVEGDDWIWVMGAALQAAAAALALLLPGRHRRVRRALAYLALAATIVGHYMLVLNGVGMALALNPGPYLIYLAMVCYTVTIIFLASVDLVCFMALLHPGRYGED